MGCLSCRKNTERGRIFRKGEALMKLFLSMLALFAAAVTLATPAHAQNYPWCAKFIAGVLRAEARIAALSAMSSAWRQLGAWAASATGTRNSCRRRARIRSGVFIRTDGIAAVEKYHLRTRGPLTRRERWRGEFQNFSARRSIEHNAAPVTVEAGKDGTQIVL
jgi:hypothetical protein